MSFISIKNDYDYLMSSNKKGYAFQGYGDETANEIHEKLYFMARLFMIYDNLLSNVKTASEKEYLDLFTDNIIDIITTMGAAAASEEAKNIVKNDSLFKEDLAFGNRSGKVKKLKISKRSKLYKGLKFYFGN